jgi:hypothetical protein
MKMKLLNRGKHLGIYWNIELVMGLKRDYSMDWFKGKITGTPSYFMGKSMVYYGFL